MPAVRITARCWDTFALGTPRMFTSSPTVFSPSLRAFIISSLLALARVLGNTQPKRDRFLRVALVTGLVLAGVAAFTAVYVAAQIALGKPDLDRNLTNGLFFAFLVLALFMIAIPVVVRLHWEDVEKDEQFTADDWATRLRALMTVSLTIILLVFVLAWFATPERLVVQVTTTSGTGTNATQNSTVQLHPFVKVFVDAFMVVVAFYFPTAAAQSIAKTLKSNAGDGGSLGPKEQSQRRGGGG